MHHALLFVALSYLGPIDTKDGSFMIVRGFGNSSSIWLNFVQSNLSYKMSTVVHFIDCKHILHYPRTEQLIYRLVVRRQVLRCHQEEETQPTSSSCTFKIKAFKALLFLYIPQSQELAFFVCLVYLDVMKRELFVFKAVAPQSIKAERVTKDVVDVYATIQRLTCWKSTTVCNKGSCKEQKL